MLDTLELLLFPFSLDYPLRVCNLLLVFHFDIDPAGSKLVPTDVVCRYSLDVSLRGCLKYPTVSVVCFATLVKVGSVACW